MGQGSTTLAGAGAAPQDNPPRQQSIEDGSSNQERGGGKGNVRKQVRSASIQQEGERLRRSPSLSLYPISRVMDAKLKHRDKQRVTAVCSLGVLGKAVSLVKSVTISAPVDIIFMCRILAFLLDVLDFLRYQAADLFLSFCHDFHPLSERYRPPAPAH